ncbi:MAG: sialate O-acetylesterase [Planctomycetaceae bacterium]|nr:sialate O-acetylesterase [Planctomycetaceae bacterium]
MPTRPIVRLELRLAAVVLLVLCVSRPGAAEVPREGPVKVFLLAGQSNMVGAGRIEANPDRNEGRGSLEWMVESSPLGAKVRGLRDSSGEWVEREDVLIWNFGRTGGLKPGYGSNPGNIGPELGFGTVVGEALDEPVLLIKIAWGGKSIGKDFRPPSAGGEVGPEYRILVDLTREVLQDAARHFPELAGRTFELAGIGWHQGWNDRVNQEFNDAYETNLAHFIRDIRRDLDAPGLPFVIAETGMSGPDEKHPRALSLMAAQAAVAKRPEFRDDVAFVGTRAFYRPPEQSPSGQQYHWNSNAETYYLIGEAMGVAMLDLLDRSKRSK